ncbi:hypothetical protein B566_EDAN004346 [Ephemera danica]|nr:hypothetical protein B566_EDAN004346 [Ephemera danica]
MGLCKCPKKRVTNQFCFDHRVNVCEHCMVTNHPKCIVQSYLQWLQDSDYKPICELCSRDLAQEDCVRLICYHVYHWACLDQFARQLPPHTAPAGYSCPCCKKGLFPAGNLVSPVADVLREVLAGVNWARAGLGLPLLSEDREQKPVLERRAIVAADGAADPSSPSLNHAVPDSSRNTPKRSMQQSLPATTSNNQYSVVHVEAETGAAFSRSDSLSQPMRKVFGAIDESKSMLCDHDEDKYKRRSAMEWLRRWWKSTATPVSGRGRSLGGLYRRYVMLAVLLVFALMTLIMIFSWLGRMATENDPNLDINQNPMLHVKRS